MNPCFKHILKHLGRAFRLSIFDAEEALGEHAQLIHAFLLGEGPVRLLATLRAEGDVAASSNEEAAGEGEKLDKKTRADGGTGVRIHVQADLDAPVASRCVLLLRLHEKEAVTPANMDSALHVSVLSGAPTKTLRASLEHVYLPLLAHEAEVTPLGVEKGLGKEDEEDTGVVAAVTKFTECLAAAEEDRKGGIKLQLPNQHAIENTPETIKSAAASEEIVFDFTTAFKSWCDQVSLTLKDGSAERIAEADDLGPRTELVFWRGRLSKFNALAEQLRSHEFKVVVSVLTTAKPKTLKRWQSLETTVADAVNEATDNVKYLSTLEPFLAPLYSGSLVALADSLPALFTNLKMLLLLSRYFHTAECISTLLRKITAQLLRRMRSFVEEEGSVWAQPAETVVLKLKQCIELDEVRADGA